MCNTTDSIPTKCVAGVMSLYTVVIVVAMNAVAFIAGHVILMVFFLEKEWE